MPEPLIEEPRSIAAKHPRGGFRTYADVAARVRIPAGFLLAATYLIFAAPSRKSVIWGASVAVFGLLLRAASAGHLRKNQKLVTSGPYAYTRNPLYLGSALAGVGLCVAGGHWWYLVLLAIFFSAVYWPVVRREERHLSQLFPEEFSEYARRVPALLPRLRPWRRQHSTDAFDWRLYLKNREYRAALGYVLIVIFLMVKIVYTS